MWHSILQMLAKILIVPTIFLMGAAGYNTAPLQPVAQTQVPQYGAFNPTGGTTYYLSSTITSSQNTITLSSFEEPGSNIPYTMSYLNSTIEYGTVAPQTSTSEFVSFTGITQNSDGSATLTGVVRGLGRSYPYAASSTLAQPHAGQSRFILSNPPELYVSYASLANPNTFSAVNTFSSTSPPTYDFDPVWANFSGTTLASVDYVNSVGSTGCANSSETVRGCSQLSTAAQAAAGTSAGSTGARLVLPGSLATSTPGTNATNQIPVTIAGKLAQAFEDLTVLWSFSNLSSASTTLTGSLAIKGFPLVFPSSFGSSGYFLSTDGAGNLSWGPSKFSSISVNPNVNASAAPSATTTLLSVTVPANSINASSQELKIEALFAGSQGGKCYAQIDYGNNTSTTTLGYVEYDSGYAYVTSSLFATSTASETSFTQLLSSGAGRTFITNDTFSVLDTEYPLQTITSPTFIAFRVTSSPSGATCRLNSESVVILSQ